MKKFVIENKFQKLTLLNYGATMHKWKTFSNKQNILISNLNLEDYLNSKNGYMGMTVGRVCNRIKDAKFTLNNKEYILDKNFGNATGHGGNDGFSFKRFDCISHTNTKITFKYFSKHLESNYPGNVEIFVTYELKDNILELTYEATTDEDTILNITNHSYFNLSDEVDVLNHNLFATSKRTLETDLDFVPTGKILNNENNVLNLTKNDKLKNIILDDDVIKKADGLDHFFLFDEDTNKELILSYKNKSLKITSSYPGLQIYTFQKPIYQPFINRDHKKYVGIAFEPSYEPDAINHPNFSNIILRKNETYKETITYTLEESNE